MKIPELSGLALRIEPEDFIIATGKQYSVRDFVVNDIIFEVGGKSKSKKQIKNRSETAYLVKDDILYGSKHEIPLHLFGFLY